MTTPGTFDPEVAKRTGLRWAAEDEARRQRESQHLINLGAALLGPVETPKPKLGRWLEWRRA